MAIYSSGSVQIKTGSAAVKGDSGIEDFSTYANSGYLFKLTSESQFYEIANVVNASNLTLTSRYSNSAYQTARSENTATVNTATRIYSGILDYNPIIQNYVQINASLETFVDDGAGILTGDGSPTGSGTIDYNTAAWSITLGTNISATAVISASYFSGDTRNGIAYQIVTDYTPNQDYPEMSLNDVNFPHVYTKFVRMVDSDISRVATAIKKRIVDHGTATVVTLVATDWNKVHNFKNTTSCVITCPTATIDDKGAWIQCRKKGSGNIDIKRGGTNTFIDTATHFANINSTQTYAYLTLLVDTATNLGIDAMFGEWSSS